MRNARYPGPPGSEAEAFFPLIPAAFVGLGVENLNDVTCAWLLCAESTFVCLLC